VICGHLETGGALGIEVCEAVSGHPGDHVMVPFIHWADGEVRWHQRIGRDIPQWLIDIATRARAAGATDVPEPLAERGEDMDDNNSPAQCGAVRREGGDVLRCARQAGHDTAIHPHGPWIKIGAVSEDQEGIPVGRILDALWEETSQEDPDAWQSPDAAGRSVEPTTNEAPQASTGWGATGRGDHTGVTHIDFDIPKPKGAGVASIAEVKAAIDAAAHHAQEANQAFLAAKDKMNEAVSLLAIALEGSGHDSVAAALSHFSSAAEGVDEIVQDVLAGLEKAQSYGAAL
jgi:hypothetical protein